MTQKNDGPKYLPRLAAGIGISVIALVGFYAAALIYFAWPIDELSVDQSGVFGDSFGVLTSLFSGLAFGGLIVTILYQREDLKIQSRELHLTREELRLTRAEMKNQNFEATFFQMLRLHNDIVNAIDIPLQGGGGVERAATGRDCFSVFVEALEDKFASEIHTSSENAPETMEAAYNKFWRRHQQKLGHYFRYLYRIFKFVDESEMINKHLYSGIVRAQLSTQELVLLYYNCISPNGKKWKRIIEEYEMFDNLPRNQVFRPSHIRFHPAKVWGEQKDAVLSEGMDAIARPITQ